MLAVALLVVAIAYLALRLFGSEGPELGGQAPTPETLDITGDAIGSGEASGDATITYNVAPGDTLGTIAARFGVDLSTLMRLNGITDADAIYVGQALDLRVVPERDGPANRVIPDSELVYGPAYVGFDVAGFIAKQGGALASHRELVDGQPTTAAEIVERVSSELSVGPRVLLAFVEARSGQVTGVTAPGLMDYPAGLVDPARRGLWWQLTWLADRLNGGYYDAKTRDNRLLTLLDGVHLSGHPELNAGSFAVQRALALQSSEAELAPRLADFERAYRALFGDPWERALPMKGAADFPKLSIPWAPGQAWWMTGGPHGGWAEGSAWAALDFVPPGEERGCFVSSEWATAAADGVLVEGAVGEVWIDIDGDGDRRTGPVVQYLHISSQDRTPAGTRLRQGDPIGHPSCEGGMSSATHIHFSRMLDGEWLAAAGEAPMVIGRWTAWGTGQSYDGGLRDGKEEREACECRLEGGNDVGW